MIKALKPKEKKSMYLVAILSIFLTHASCEKEEPDTYECVTHKNISFSAHISPILRLKCMNGSCHRKFNDYDYVKRYVDNNALLGSIQHKKGYSPMPKNEDKLADSLIVTISCWIQNGAPKN